MLNKFKYLLLCAGLLATGCRPILTKASDHAVIDQISEADDTATDQISDDSNTDQSDVNADTDQSSEDENSDQSDASEDEHTIYEAEDVVEYFNSKSVAPVEYIEENNYWYLHYYIEDSVDDTKEHLKENVHIFVDYLPIYNKSDHGYLFRYKEQYNEDEHYYVYTAVSSNWFAASTIYGYVENEKLFIDTYIYDARTGIYE